eukprot:g2813.t1
MQLHASNGQVTSYPSAMIYVSYVVFALALAPGKVPPIAPITFQKAREALTLSQQQLRKVEALGMSEQRKLRASIASIDRVYAANKKRIIRVMKADAMINSVDVSTLNPNDYGLPKHPMDRVPQNEARLCKTFVSLAQAALQKLKAVNHALWRRRLVPNSLASVPAPVPTPATAPFSGVLPAATPAALAAVTMSLPLTAATATATYGDGGIVDGSAGNTGGAGDGSDGSGAPSASGRSPLDRALDDCRHALERLQREYEHRAVAAARLSFAAKNALAVLDSKEAVRAVQTAELSVVGNLAVKRIVMATTAARQRLRPVAALAPSLRAAYLRRKRSLLALRKKLALRFGSDEAKALRAALMTPEFNMLRKEFGEEVHAQVKALAVVHSREKDRWDAPFGPVALHTT